MHCHCASDKILSKFFVLNRCLGGSQNSTANVIDKIRIPPKSRPTLTCRVDPNSYQDNPKR